MKKRFEEAGMKWTEPESKAKRGKQIHCYMELVMNLLNEREPEWGFDRAFKIADQVMPANLVSVEMQNYVRGLILTKTKRIVSVEEVRDGHRLDLLALMVDDKVMVLDWKSGNRYKYKSKYWLEYGRNDEIQVLTYLIKWNASYAAIAYVDQRETVWYIKRPDGKIIRAEMVVGKLDQVEVDKEVEKVARSSADCEDDIEKQLQKLSI